MLSGWWSLKKTIKSVFLLKVSSSWKYLLLESIRRHRRVTDLQDKMMMIRWMIISSFLMIIFLLFSLSFSFHFFLFKFFLFSLTLISTWNFLSLSLSLSNRRNREGNKLWHTTTFCLQNLETSHEVVCIHTCITHMYNSSITHSITHSIAQSITHSITHLDYWMCWEKDS